MQPPVAQRVGHGAHVSSLLGSATMRFWDDELEGLRPKFREEAATFLASVPRAGPDAERLPMAERVALQRSSEMGSPPSSRAVDRTIDGPAGPLRLRMFTHDAPNAVLFHIHGGGWIAGAPEMMDLLHEVLVDT